MKISVVTRSSKTSSLVNRSQLRNKIKFSISYIATILSHFLFYEVVWYKYLQSIVVYRHKRGALDEHPMPPHCLYQCRILHVPQPRTHTQFWLRSFLLWLIQDILAHCNVGRKVNASVDDHGGFWFNREIQVDKIERVKSKSLITSIDNNLFLLKFRDEESSRCLYYAKLYQPFLSSAKTRFFRELKPLPKLPKEADEGWWSVINLDLLYSIAGGSKLIVEA
jgi:hypothetical protein